METLNKTAYRRLTALDVMRGITIVGMIIVNNSGGGESFPALQHSSWNGLTPCDLVFPFFLFIMGVTTYLSLAKTDFQASAHFAQNRKAHSVYTTYLLGTTLAGQYMLRP